MKKQSYSITIAIDAERSVFHFYSMIGNDRATIAHHIKSYSGPLFDDEFFKKFKDALKEYAENNPAEGIRKVTVILPDCAVLTDTVKVPTMKGFGQTQKTLDTALGGLYRNYKELRVVSGIAQQNKQYSTFAISAVQKHIVSSIYAACSENKMLVDTLTYASSAAISGVVAADPSLKNSSYLFLDIKDVYSRFVFVANGKAVGYYILPFGHELLKKSKVIGEDMLFDHSYAELAVLNAGEKARSKKLTVMSFDDEESEELEEDLPLVDGEAVEEMAEEAVDEALEDAIVQDEPSEEEPIEEETEAEEIVADEADEMIPETAEITHPRVNRKIFSKKTPRRLPQFMLREIPDTQEGISAENFRVFVKWALTLIGGNDKLTELGKPEFVCVNIPSELKMVLDKINEEAEENGINFVGLQGSDESAIFSDIELYGGFFPAQITPTGKF